VIAADSFSACRWSRWPRQFRHQRGTSLRMIAGIIWKVDALPTPVTKNMKMKHGEEAGEAPWRSCRGSRSRPVPSIIMPMNTQKVTRAPPSVGNPAGQRARLSAPTSGPRKAYCSTLTSGTGLGSSGNAGREADERAERAGVEPAHDPVVLALEDHRLLGKDALASRCRSCRTRRQAEAMMNGTQMKPAFCSQSWSPSWPPADPRQASRTRWR
jgi:hypothetical protein